MQELKSTLYSNGGFVVSKDYIIDDIFSKIRYFGEAIAQGFGCNLCPDEDGKYQVWVVCQGNLYYLAGADTNKQALAMANNLNDAWDRIVAREKEDAEWPLVL